MTECLPQKKKNARHSDSMKFRQGSNGGSTMPRLADNGKAMLSGPGAGLVLSVGCGQNQVWSNQLWPEPSFVISTFFGQIDQNLCLNVLDHFMCFCFVFSLLFLFLFFFYISCSFFSLSTLFFFFSFVHFAFYFVFRRAAQHFRSFFHLSCQNFLSFPSLTQCGETKNFSSLPMVVGRSWCEKRHKNQHASMLGQLK